MRKLTLEEFISRSRVIHGNNNDYGKFVYTDTRTKGLIGCHVDGHGYFLQTPDNHLRGQSCPKCGVLTIANRLRSNTQEFIAKAIAIHGNKCSYNKAVYINTHVKVILTCLVDDHGDFEQTPHNHLQGQGCPKCKAVLFGNRRRSNLQEFIAKANIVHNGKYGYNKYIYIDVNTKGIVTCPVDGHGDFLQTPTCHLNTKHGCPKCGNDSKKITLEEFIAKARIVHGDRYGYGKFICIDGKTKGIVTCPVDGHGDFLQTPESHMNGNGCSKCNSSKGELALLAIFEKNNINYIRQYIIPESTLRYRYDFYLPDYNLLIEFHGGQHYASVEFFGGETAFKERRQNDRIKKWLANDTGYNLMVFHFKHHRLFKKERFEAFVLRRLNIAIKKYITTCMIH